MIDGRKQIWVDFMVVVVDSMTLSTIHRPISMSSRYQDRDRDEGRYSRDEPDRRDRGEDRRRKYEPEEETYRSPRRDRERDERARPADRARSRSPKREPGSSRYDGELCSASHRHLKLTYRPR